MLPETKKDAKDTPIKERTFFYVKDESNVELMMYWLGFKKFNAVAANACDRKGQPLIGLKYGTENAGIIVCANSGLLNKILPLVNQKKS